MTVAMLRSLAAYNRWANARVLDAAAALNAEDLGRDLRASFRSLQGTLIHIVWGEQGWLHLWQHGVFLREPADGDYPDIESLRGAWSRHETAYAAYLAGLTQADLDSPRAVEANTYPLGELVQHILNHSTYHRGQAALLLRQLGQEPPPTDYRYFLTQTRANV